MRGWKSYPLTVYPNIWGDYYKQLLPSLKLTASLHLEALGLEDKAFLLGRRLPGANCYNVSFREGRTGTEGPWLFAEYCRLYVLPTYMGILKEAIIYKVPIMNKKSVKWNVSQGCCFHCSFCFSFVCCCGARGNRLREHLPIKRTGCSTEPCLQGSKSSKITGWTKGRSLKVTPKPCTNYGQITPRWWVSDFSFSTSSPELWGRVPCWRWFFSLRGFKSHQLYRLIVSPYIFGCIQVGWSIPPINMGFMKFLNDESYILSPPR